MNLFSTLAGRTRADKTARWRHELLQILAVAAVADVALSDDGHGVVRRESGHVFLTFDFDEEERAYLVLCAPLVSLPDEDASALYRWLLDLNDHDLLLGRLATSGDAVVLRCSLPLDGLSEEMFAHHLLEIIAEADFIEKDLSEEFGVERFAWQRPGPKLAD